MRPAWQPAPATKRWQKDRMKHYTAEQVVDELRRRVTTFGPTKTSAALGISATMIHAVIAGKRKLSPRVALAVGFKRNPESFTRISNATEARNDSLVNDCRAKGCVTH